MEMLLVLFAIILVYVLCNQSGFMDGSGPSGILSDPSGPVTPPPPLSPTEKPYWIALIISGILILLSMVLLCVREHRVCCYEFWYGCFDICNDSYF